MRLLKVLCWVIPLETLGIAMLIFIGSVVVCVVMSFIGDSP